MTYKEIKARLSKCELKLNQYKNGQFGTIDKSEVEEKVRKLTILKESLKKQLSEADKTAFINGQPAEYSDEKELAKFKDNPDVKSIKTATGKKIKEQEGAKFTVDETKSIAKAVGKAVAKSLHTLGDEVAHMKAKNIEENSFEIYVEYKNESDDQFSFYITDDTLHLVDFSFDKEIGDVGVKPSGEAVVHVDVIANELTKHFKSLNETEVSEAPEGMYYIKIPKDAASQNKAQVIFNDLYGIKYEINDDPDGIVMYFKKEDFDPGLEDDLMGDQVKILDTNMPLSEGDVDTEHDGGDLDVGHQDDEPNMLKKDIYDVITYAAKLYKQLDKYDQHDGEVDFPHWWQKKVTLAREYMSAAQHYLEGEEKQPAIDQLALEERVKVLKEDWGGSDQRAMNQQIHKALGEPKKMPSPFDDKLEYAVQDAVDFHWDDWPEYQQDREGLYTQAKRAYLRAMFRDTFDKMVRMFEPVEEGKYKSDAQRKAIHAKKAEMNEASYDDAIAELRNVVDQAVDLGEEAREIVRQYFRDELSRLDSYGAFDLVYSNNRYDVTLGRFVDRLEEEGYDGDNDDDDDMDEGVAKTKKAYDLVVTKMKDLAKQYKAGDTSVISQLKDLTAKKKQLEKMLDKDVAGINKDQELSELFGAKLNYDEIIGPIVKKLHDLKKYVSKKEPDAMEDLQKVIRAFEIFDEKMAYGTHMELEEEKATYCGACGKTHKKSQSCPK